MRCLVLGGGGFLGSHLCDGLIGAGHDVRIFERIRVEKTNIAHLLNQVELFEGDFADPCHFAEIVEGIDVVFHLISTTVPKTSNDNPEYDVETNVIPTLHFLDVARKSGVQKIIFFSSGGTVYGIPKQIPIQEDHPTNPICSYGIHKLMIEKYLTLYHHLYGLDYRILRIANPYGERQRPIGDQAVVAAFLRHALQNEPLEIWGDGSVIRDYIYVADVIKAVLCVLHYQGPHKIFNVGTGKGLSLLEIAKIIEEVVGYTLTINFTSARKLDVPVNVLQTDRACHELHWRPAISFHQGIENIINHSNNYENTNTKGK